MYYVLNKTIGVEIGETVQWVLKSYLDFFKYAGDIYKKQIK